MKIFNLLLIGIIIISSCSNSSNGTSVTTKSDSTIKWTKLISGNQCNMETSLDVLITNQAQFDSIWTKAFTMDMPPEKPVIDFAKNSVVALFLGTVNKGGHSIEIAAINQSTDKEISIEAIHKLPGKNCFSTMAIEFPYYWALTDVVINEKTTFTTNKKEVDCE